MRFRIFDSANKRRRSYVAAEITYERKTPFAITEITEDVLLDALISYRKTSTGEYWISSEDFDELSEYIDYLCAEQDDAESDIRYCYKAEIYEECILDGSDNITYVVQYGIIGEGHWEKICEGYHNAWEFCRKFCEEQAEKQAGKNVYDNIGCAHVHTVGGIEAIASFSTLDIIAK